jgi:hypothetical protein
MRAGHFPKTLELLVKKIILPIGVAALLVTACGKKEEAAPAPEATPPPAATQPAAPAEAPAAAPQPQAEQQKDDKPKQ